MAKVGLFKILTITLGLAMVGLFTITAMAADAPRMTKEELKSQLDSSDVVIVDVRVGKDWKASEFKIKGAVRVQPKDLVSWASKHAKDKTLVLYCAWPDEKTSASLAQKLMDKGYTKVYALKGGWREWFRAKYPVQEK